MKTIFRIAKTELFTLFYSPVAWLVLIIFAFQGGMEFTDTFGKCVKHQVLGYNLYNVTSRIYTGYSLFDMMLNNLYLYIPLLTMGLVSREIGSGSIKLLFSSPITNVKIILGKYLAMMIYCFSLILILSSFIVFGGFTIKDMDFPAVLSALLGTYLLICAYSAIGLFMSCLTSYQVVAAMGTLAVLAVFNFIGGIGQEIAFVREITYWLSIAGRTKELMAGLICSEDILYFLIVISLFVCFSILKLNSSVQKNSIFVTIGKYAGVFFIACMLGYFSSRPTLMAYYDTTATKSNTLTKNSQEIMAKLDGGLTMTTYVNLLDDDFMTGAPRAVKYDMDRFSKYVRFKPEMEMKYVYYYDKVENSSIYRYFPNKTDKEIAEQMCKARGYDMDMFLSPEEIKKVIDLEPEGNRFVRQIVRENGQKAYLRLFNDNQRHPSETEITAALKSFVVKAPKVGFLTGHGERVIDRNRDKDYSAFVNNRSFRSSLINQGFEGVNLTLSKNIPDDIDIIVIADIRKSFTNEEQAKLENYIDRGGNLIIASDANRQDVINPFIEKLGVKMTQGVLVQPMQDVVPDVIAGNITRATKDISSQMYNLYRYDYKIAMPGASGLEYVEEKGYNVTPLIVTNTEGSWSELETTNFIDEKVELNPKKGEVEKSAPIALALSRKVADKEQRIIVLGDSDFISNGELSRSRSNINSANFSFIPAMFQWLSYDEYPVNTNRVRPPDNEIFFNRSNMIYVNIFYKGILPLLLGLFGGILLLRRQRQ